MVLSSAVDIANKQSSRRYELSLASLCALIAVNLVLVGACLLLLWQNSKLNSAAEGYMALLRPIGGVQAGSLDGTDWTGTPITVSYGADRRSTLIYSFSQRCPYCQENWAALKRLQVLDPKSLRIIYIDTVGDRFTQKYLYDNGIGHSPLFVQLSPSAKYVYEARLRPQVVLVDAKGEVQWSHNGRLAPADISKIVSMIEPT